VCTLVDKDKSMEAMIRNDSEKEWMEPLMKFRNEYLYIKEDRQHRDFRRMNGSLMLHNGRLVHGPYRQHYRERLLSALLKAQCDVRTSAELGEAPEAAKDFKAISLDELEEIRRIWVVEKHEIEDRLPRIFAEVTGERYPGKVLNQTVSLGADDIVLLKEVCDESGDPEGMHFELIRELLHIEDRYRTKARRAGLYKALDKALERGAFQTEAEAEDFAIRRQSAASTARELIQEDMPEYVRVANAAGETLV
jgi:DNA sulfur modification protein DndC